MKFKLDENLGRSAYTAFVDAGHDISTVHLQQLSGAPDYKVFVVCRAESRVLVTCDLDFANPLVYDPRTTSGIAVLRMPSTPAPADVQSVIVTLLRALDQHDIAGALWIVRPERVRVWTPPDQDPDGRP